MSTGFDKGPQRKSGRYESEQQIIAKIDQAKREAVELNKQADALDLKADGLRGKPEAASFLQEWRDNAQKLRLQATRKLEIRCKFLSDKLAVFRTDILPGFEMDRGIPKVGSDKFAERSNSKK